MVRMYECYRDVVDEIFYIKGEFEEMLVNTYITNVYYNKIKNNLKIYYINKEKIIYEDEIIYIYTEEVDEIPIFINIDMTKSEKREFIFLRLQDIELNNSDLDGSFVVKNIEKIKEIEKYIKKYKKNLKKITENMEV